MLFCALSYLVYIFLRVVFTSVWLTLAFLFYFFLSASPSQTSEMRLVPPKSRVAIERDGWNILLRSLTCSRKKMYDENDSLQLFSFLRPASLQTGRIRILMWPTNLHGLRGRYSSIFFKIAENIRAYTRNAGRFLWRRSS